MAEIRKVLYTHNIWFHDDCRSTEEFQWDNISPKVKTLWKPPTPTCWPPRTSFLLHQIISPPAGEDINWHWSHCFQLNVKRKGVLILWQNFSIVPHFILFPPICSWKLLTGGKETSISLLLLLDGICSIIITIKIILLIIIIITKESFSWSSSSPFKCIVCIWW